MAEPSPPSSVFPTELPVLPLRRTVAFPLTLQPLAVNRPMSVEAVNAALAGDRLILMVLQKGDDEEPKPDQMHAIGTIGIVRQMATGPQGLNIIVEGMARARVGRGHVREQHDARPADARARAGADRRRSRRLRPARPGAGRSRALALTSGLAPEVRQLVAGIDDPLRLVLSARHDARPEGRGETAAARGRSAAQEARAGAHAAGARSLGARAQRQDRVAGAAGDDRRAEAVLPAPADEGDPGRARRGRRQRDQGCCASAIAQAKLPAHVEDGRRARGRSPGAHGTRPRPNTR